MKTKQQSKTWDFVRNCLFILVGGLIYDTGIYVFASSGGFATGGITGLSLMAHHLWGLPMGIVTIALNVPLALLSMRILGKRFLVNSVTTLLVFNIMLDTLFPLLPKYQGDPLLAAVFAGVFIGGGLALVYMSGSSSGGTDFLTLSIRKKYPHFSVGGIALSIDAVILLMGGLVYGNLNAVLYGVICSFAGSVTMDKILYGMGSGKLVIVITDKGRETAEAIDAEIDRGSTLVDAVGSYSGEAREMLLCACGKSQVYRVRRIAHDVSPNAFVMITEANEVYGEGFTLPESGKA